VNLQFLVLCAVSHASSERASRHGRRTDGDVRVIRRPAKLIVADKI
jgi:hypothetical protein